jgi:hypothetical protein
MINHGNLQGERLYKTEQNRIMLHPNIKPRVSAIEGGNK